MATVKLDMFQQLCVWRPTNALGLRLVQVRTKKCKDCGLHLALRHFKPSVKEPGGLFSICDGCNFRINTYRRLITKQKLTAAE